jgi:hypothetical protein
MAGAGFPYGPNVPASIAVLDPRLRDYSLLLERKDLASELDAISIPAGAILAVTQDENLIIPEMGTGKAIRIVHCFAQAIDLTGTSKLSALIGNIRYEVLSGSSLRITSEAWPGGVVIGTPAAGALENAYIAVEDDDQVFLWTDYPNLGNLSSGLQIAPSFTIQNLDGAAAHSISLFTRVLYEVWQERYGK